MHLDVLAQLCDGLADQFLDGDLRIADEGLLIQTYRLGGLLAITELRFEPRPRLIWHRAGPHITRVHRRDLHRDLARQGLEVRGAGDEVGLAVELDHRGDAATGVDVCLDHALERRAA